MALRVCMRNLTVALTLALTLTLVDAAENGEEGESLHELFVDMNQLKDYVMEMTAKYSTNQSGPGSGSSGAVENAIKTLTQSVASLEAKLTEIRKDMSKIQSNSGGVSSFIRWGSSRCPHTADLIYTGIVGTSRWNESGGGSNRLCLSKEPTFDAFAPLRGFANAIYGTEWYVPGHNAADVPCAVCSVQKSLTIMIPGTKHCLPGWTLQYTGHIVSTDNYFPTQSDFLCADSYPEGIQGTLMERGDGNYFMYTIASCGSLPCPPYNDGKVITCVVCSK